MSAMTTLPPFSAAMRAVAAPRPDAPPVTRNTLFLICIGCSRGNKVMPEKFADNSNLMQLGFGIAFPDLYEREGLIRVDRAFVAYLAEADRSLADKLSAARASPPSGGAESELLIALAPHVEDFIAKLFQIESEADALA